MVWLFFDHSVRRGCNSSAEEHTGKRMNWIDHLHVSLAYIIYRKARSNDTFSPHRPGLYESMIQISAIWMGSAATNGQWETPPATVAKTVPDLVLTKVERP